MSSRSKSTKIPNEVKYTVIIHKTPYAHTRKHTANKPVICIKQKSQIIFSTSINNHKQQTNLRFRPFRSHQYTQTTFKIVENTRQKHENAEQKSREFS